MVIEGKNNSVFGSLLFPNIFKSFRMAIQPSKLMIAFLAVGCICIAGWIMDFGETVVLSRDQQVSELQVYVNQPGQFEDFLEENQEHHMRTGVFAAMRQFASEKFHLALKDVFVLDMRAAAEKAGDYLRAVSWAVKYHPIYCILFGIIELAVLAVAAGAICRIAALQLARGEKPGFTEALRYSTKNFFDFFYAPLAAVLIIIGIGLFIVLLGVFANIPVIGDIVLGILAIFALLAGALMAIMIIGTGAGFNLMFPAVGYDGSDAFDAISRAFSYIYARPWHMAFYSIVAGAYGAVCYGFVRFFAFLIIAGTRTLLAVGIFVDGGTEGPDKLAAMWPSLSFINFFGVAERDPATWSQGFAAFFIHLFVLIIAALVASFLLSFYFTANTVIYGLMRKKVDGTELSDIHIPFEEEEIETEEQTETGEDV